MNHETMADVIIRNDNSFASAEWIGRLRKDISPAQLKALSEVGIIAAVILNHSEPSQQTYYSVSDTHRAFESNVPAAIRNVLFEQTS